MEISDKPKYVEYREWVKRGIMWIRTDALDVDDPDTPYNQVKAQGLIPEEYGLFAPDKLDCNH